MLLDTVADAILKQILALSIISWGGGESQGAPKYDVGILKPKKHTKQEIWDGTLATKLN